MVYLKLMGAYTFLRKKLGRMSMMDSFRLELDDVSHVDEIQINGMNFCYEHPLSLHRLKKHLFNVERCVSLSEFVVLTKMDFQQERHLKTRMFGREFENHDCPSLMKNYLRCITLDQTFSDDLAKCIMKVDVH